MTNKEAIIQALKSVADVGGTGDIVSGGRVEGIDVNGGKVKLTLSLPAVARDEQYRIEDACSDAIESLEGVEDVMVRVRGPEEGPPQAPGAAGAPGTGDPFKDQAPIQGVKNIIAVASGKGGVGKSTVCVNLGLALQRRGATVGLLDADIYGPSLHILLGVKPELRPGKTKEIAAVADNGLKLMSLGFLTDREMPVIWRGPIVAGIVKKFLHDVEWGELDYLMVDLPPGTGDAQLTLAQSVPITSAIIVTTPSLLALVDAEKGLRMFGEVQVPVLGIVENMSTFVCPHCGKSTHIFDSEGGKKIGDRTSVEVLGRIPLDPDVRSGGDRGEPVVRANGESAVSRSFLEIADKIRERFPVGA